MHGTPLTCKQQNPHVTIFRQAFAHMHEEDMYIGDV